MPYLPYFGLPVGAKRDFSSKAISNGKEGSRCVSLPLYSDKSARRAGYLISYLSVSLAKESLPFSFLSMNVQINEAKVLEELCYLITFYNCELRD